MFCHKTHSDKERSEKKMGFFAAYEQFQLICIGSVLVWVCVCVGVGLGGVAGVAVAVL